MKFSTLSFVLLSAVIYSASASTCDTCSRIDVGFYETTHNSPYGICLNAKKTSWDSSSTPSDFLYCRTNVGCSEYGQKKCGGTCVKNERSCKAAETYCDGLGGTIEHCEDK
ncbi:hypothetical protein BDB01DRAFT_847174 [Pilobolus umbonatus]|nr:hypothetical protein BDB01DRAFT_847174 [Pilobolus umbonatus]